MREDDEVVFSVKLRDKVITIPTYFLLTLCVRMRSEDYGSRSVCLSVCLFVSNYSRTAGYEVVYERYQQLQCYKGKKTNVAFLLTPLRSGIWRENKRKS